MCKKCAKYWLHPGRLTVGTYKLPIYRNENDQNQTSMTIFHVNPQGCTWKDYIPAPSSLGVKWFLKVVNLPSLRDELAPLGRCWCTVVNQFDVFIFMKFILHAAVAVAPLMYRAFKRIWSDGVLTVDRMSLWFLLLCVFRYCGSSLVFEDVFFTKLAWQLCATLAEMDWSRPMPKQ